MNLYEYYELGLHLEDPYERYTHLQSKHTDPLESGWYFDVIESGLVTAHESFTLVDGSMLEVVVAGGKTFLYHEVTDRLM